MQVQLSPEINRINRNRTAEEMYDIFRKSDKFELRNAPETRDTALVDYDDIFDAKNAYEHLSFFNVCNWYLVVLYYQASKAFKKIYIEKKQEEIDKMKSKYGINT